MSEEQKVEFEPITTQEEFDQRISKRLQREKEKFADYETLKNSNTEFESRIQQLSAEIESLNGKVLEKDNLYNSAQNEISNLKLKDLKRVIAIEKGLPLELADRLVGEDEDSLRKDAETFASYTERKPEPIKKDNEPTTISDAERKYGNLI